MINYSSQRQSGIGPKNSTNISYHSFFFKFTASLYLTQFLVESANIIYPEYFDKLHSEINRKILNLNEKDKKEFDYFMKKRKSKKSAKKIIFIKSSKTQKMMADIDKLHYQMESLKPLFLEMSLISIIIKFEELLSDQLFMLYKKNPQMLKNKEMKFGEVFKTDEKKILENISKKTIKEILRYDIVNINDYLIKKTNLDLSKNKNWKKFIERFYRRNILIHNAGFTDEEYHTKTKTPKQIKKINITHSYLIQSINIFANISHEMTDFFERKYGVKKYHKGKPYFRQL